MPHQNPDNEIAVLITASIILFVVVSGLLIFVLIFSIRKKLLHQHELLQSQLEIQEQTMQHISAELHDNLGQVASLIKINLHTIPLNDATLAAQKLEETRALTRQLITDMKSLSVSLSSDRVARQGLAAVLQSDIDRISKTGQFTATYNQEGNMPSLDNDTATILYRMAQEILNNMVKHSQAQHINVNLAASENNITLAISDDGTGFDVTEKMQEGNGAGLHNLQKRASLIKANLTIQSSLGNGTQATIQLPYNYDPRITDQTGPRR